ncbi:ESCRT-II subunit protein VPS36 [Sugiyamaella lignohabitans]|uniref:Vacuolar protein-sorting-associated protein 36 n=1 Tax=Sugiyamaella lignohabitans TaxID=796027 RepID=A0A167FS98_9ASCO|nr:ESCRT-II subunit protein VPS36 [Sugiyamaella lignohabitans]ANB15638.1 ESCRT-II subunit protein VPS36 [Sugiyamaella lignohabitans]
MVEAEVVSPSATTDIGREEVIAAVGSEGFKCPRCTFLNHPSLHQCEMCGARLISPRLPPGLIRTDSPGPTTVFEPGKSLDGTINVIKLSFRGNGDKSFFTALKKALASKEWVSASNTSLGSGIRRVTSAEKGTNAVDSQDFTPRQGIHGLQQAGERSRQQRQEILGSALDDLQGLMSRAQDLIKLAEQYAHHLEKEEMSSNNASLSARKALRQSSQALGLDSTIVTKEMAHDPEVFHSELARQLAEFLDNSGILAREGGVITLFDLFAIYNRARGFSLISPKDLYSAAELFEKLQLPIRLRKFKSGLFVVQESYRTPQVIIRHLNEWFASVEPYKAAIGFSPQDASAKFGWSLTVATEELEMAEAQGALCRDEQVSGVRFFPNLFLVN